jgi:hypothetical protein
MSKLKDLRDPASEWITGAVTTNDWHRNPFTSRLTAGFVGEVRVIAADQATGFKIEGGGHANWLALVRGPSGVVHVIPGCKVASITYDCEVVSDEYVRVP